MVCMYGRYKETNIHTYFSKGNIVPSPEKGDRKVSERNKNEIGTRWTNAVHPQVRVCVNNFNKLFNSDRKVRHDVIYLIITDKYINCKKSTQ